MKNFDIYLKEQYQNLDDDKKAAKEYLALVMFKLFKNDNKHYGNIIDDDIKKTLLEHENRLRKFIIKDTIISLITAIVLFFSGLYLKNEYWYIWIVLSVVFFVFELYIQRMTMVRRFDEKFQGKLEKEIDRTVIENIQKNI